MMTRRQIVGMPASTALVVRASTLNKSGPFDLDCQSPSLQLI